jgi:RNA polymerase sigma-70 factor (ECF subfamily)
VNVATSEAERTEQLAAVFADPTAFPRWYDDAVVRVYGYLYGRFGADPDLAEDLTQQTFLQAVRHWRAFDGRSDSVTWLCAIARNRLVDHYRLVERQQRRHLQLVVREIPVDDGGFPASFDDREAVLAALRDLPPLHRAALVLRYVDDLSVREVAKMLGRSEDATESLLRRAKERFRAIYPEASDD